MYTTFRYWHRSLNPKKLIEVKFSHLSRNMTMQRTLKLYKLPEKTRTAGFRKMVAADLPRAHKLLAEVKCNLYYLIDHIMKVIIVDLNEQRWGPRTV